MFQLSTVQGFLEARPEHLQSACVPQPLRSVDGLEDKQAEGTALLDQVKTDGQILG